MRILFCLAICLALLARTTSPALAEKVVFGADGTPVLTPDGTGVTVTPQAKLCGNTIVLKAAAHPGVVFPVGVQQDENYLGWGLTIRFVRTAFAGVVYDPGEGVIKTVGPYVVKDYGMPNLLYCGMVLLAFLCVFLFLTEDVCTTNDPGTVSCWVWFIGFVVAICVGLVDALLMIATIVCSISGLAI